MIVVEKPWGSETILEHESDYIIKKIFMKAGHRCSLQLHEKKLENFIIIRGQMKLTIGENKDTLQEIQYSCFDSHLIPIGMIHRMEALTDCTYVECSTNHMDDVVRLEDNYGRSK